MAKKSTRSKKKKSVSRVTSKAAQKTPKTVKPALCCPAHSCGPTCLFASIGSSILLSVGLFMIVAGIILQTKGAGLLNAVLWYVGGFLLMMVGKSILYKACIKCFPR